MICNSSACFLMRGTAGIACNTTDVFDSATGKWSTAELSVARFLMGAVSVGPFAIFAGGGSVDNRALWVYVWTFSCWLLCGAIMLIVFVWHL